MGEKEATLLSNLRSERSPATFRMESKAAKRGSSRQSVSFRLSAFNSRKSTPMCLQRLSLNKPLHPAEFLSATAALRQSLKRTSVLGVITNRSEDPQKIPRIAGPATHRGPVRKTLTWEV